MNSSEFKKKLTSVTPDVPEHFHFMTESTLENIVSQEAHMKASTKKALRSAGRYSARTVILAAVLAAMICAAALAATQWHVFERLHFMLGETPPSAMDTLMQENLYQETVNNVEITIREAGYDGRTLLLQYSYRLLDADTPYGVTAGELFGDHLPEGLTPDTIVEGLKGSAEEDLEAHHVGWWIDAVWLNGKEMNMPNNSGSVVTGSTVPGEIIHTEYWRLDNEGFALNGPVQISLPIGEHQDLSDYSKRNHPEKYDIDGSLKLPEKGIVTFTYDATDILSRVTTLHPEEETVLPDVTAKVREAAFSPLMTYITMDLSVNPDSLADYISANGAGPKNENGEVMWTYGGMDVFEDWILSLELVNGQGELVFPGHAGQNGYGNEWAEFLYPYLENIPAELYLAPIEDSAANMHQAVRVK
ncbi:MAG: hypothetical protein IJ242_14910 [Clostridia bacterium]|nr:hypothetical protein [Clostridia bacterium]